MSSADEGATWEALEAPAPLLDLAAAPDDPDRVIASGEGGLYESQDGGQTWRPTGPEIGYLAWPTPDALYLIDTEGTLRVSDDGGNSWESGGEIGGQPVAFTAENAEELYAALPDGSVMVSRDGGDSWSLRATVSGR